MAVADRLDKCQWCKSTKVKLAERTDGRNSQGERLEVWLCPDCDGRASNFAKVDPNQP